MKKKTSCYLPVFSMLVFLLVSCSIDKRLHSNGYFIKWHKHYPKAQENTSAEMINHEANTTAAATEIAAVEVEQATILRSDSDQDFQEIVPENEPKKNNPGLQKTK